MSRPDNSEIPITSDDEAIPASVLMVAIALIALNLRAVLSSLPTVTTDIQANTGWSDAIIGILTTIPVLVMGIAALAVPSLAMRFGRKNIISVAMLSLIIATGIRAIESVPPLLFVSAFFAGLGIAFATGLIPGIVREQLPHQMRRATSVWTGAMMTSAALGGALTVPLAKALGSWSLALAFWAIPAFIALIYWRFAEKNAPDHDRSIVRVRMRELPWSNSVAWSLGIYMALNSIVFYSSLAWVAPSFEDRGWTQENAGWLFGLFTASQVVAAFTIAPFALHAKYRRAVMSAIVILTALALLAIAWLPEFLPWLMLIVFGLCLSGGFAIALGLLSQYSRDAPSAARLSAMALFITYTTAALGPFVAGALMDSFDSWALIYSILAIVMLAHLPAIYRLRANIHIE